MNTFHYSTACRQILGDLYTPVSTYLKVRDLYPQSALMESSDYHSHDNSRSFIALNPIASIDISHGTVTAQYPDGTQESREINENYPAEQAFNDFLSRFTVTGDKQEFCGLYGYTSFNAVRYFEHIEIKDCMQEKNDAPDILYILYKYVIAFDHFNNTMTLIELVENHEPNTLDELERVIQNHNFATYDFRPVGETFSTLTDDEHKANIRQGIAHCLRGDVFQIVLSRRFVQRYEGDDFKLYRALRSINPSPYLFYFDFGGFRIFGSSPETHCRIEGRHVMLVDLARNDLSRNCHNVKVDFYKDMQYYSHVIHLVSRVSGTLDDEADPVKTFIDTFPAGTLSGAPKVRAMQLISELEPHNRGAYGGCIGFIGLNGSLNQAITIRTFVSRNNELWFQAGGGIVAKSDEDYELQEVNNKLGALRHAIQMAERL